MSSESIFEAEIYWQEVADFIERHKTNEDVFIAPIEFQQKFDAVLPYRASYAEPLDRFAWIVVHKGRTSEFDFAFLNRAAREYCAVFANEVFVVLAATRELPQLPFDAQHLRPFLNCLDAPAGAATALPAASTELKLEDLAIVSRAELERSSRLAIQTIALSNNTVLSRILSRYFCYLAAEDKSLTPHLALNGYWEPWLTQALARVLRPGWHCLDIGANCGYFALLMADAVGASGRVLAVEANPRLAELVDASLELNGFAHATVAQLAVSNVNQSQIKFVIPTDGYLGNSQISRQILNPNQQVQASLRRRLTAPRPKTIRVPTATIDALTQDWPRVDCIKIDAEGAEYAIWQGMQQTIRRNPQICLIVEFAPSRYPDPAAFVAQVQAAGFALRYVDADSQIKPIAAAELLDLSRFNYWDLFLQRP